MADHDPPDEIPPDCIVYRAIRVVDIKEDRTPKSCAFTDLADADGSKDYMSVNFSDEMAAAGKTLEDLKKHWGDRYEIFQFAAQDLVTNGERLWRDPDDDFVGHGACKRNDNGKRSLAQKRTLARLAKPANESGAPAGGDPQ